MVHIIKKLFFPYFSHIQTDGFFFFSKMASSKIDFYEDYQETVKETNIKIMKKNIRLLNTSKLILDKCINMSEKWLKEMDKNTDSITQLEITKSLLSDSIELLQKATKKLEKIWNWNICINQRIFLEKSPSKKN